MTYERDVVLKGALDLVVTAVYAASVAYLTIRLFKVLYDIRDELIRIRVSLQAVEQQAVENAPPDQDRTDEADGHDVDVFEADGDGKWTDETAEKADE